MSFGSVTEDVNDFVSKFIVNQGCSDVRVMFDSRIAQDGAIDKYCAGNRGGRYIFGFRFGFSFQRGYGTGRKIQKPGWIKD